MSMASSRRASSSSSVLLDDDASSPSEEERERDRGQGQGQGQEQGAAEVDSDKDEDKDEDEEGEDERHERLGLRRQHSNRPKHERRGPYHSSSYSPARRGPKPLTYPTHPHPHPHDPASDPSAARHAKPWTPTKGKEIIPDILDFGLRVIDKTLHVDVNREHRTHRESEESERHACFVGARPGAVLISSDVPLPAAAAAAAVGVGVDVGVGVEGGGAAREGGGEGGAPHSLSLSLSPSRHGASGSTRVQSLTPRRSGTGGAGGAGGGAGSPRGTPSYAAARRPLSLTPRGSGKKVSTAANNQASAYASASASTYASASASAVSPKGTGRKMVNVPGLGGFSLTSAFGAGSMAVRPSSSSSSSSSSAVKSKGGARQGVTRPSLPAIKQSNISAALHQEVDRILAEIALNLTAQGEERQGQGRAVASGGAGEVEE